MANPAGATKPTWLFASAVVWVATRDAALADSLVGKGGQWLYLARRLVPYAALAAAHDALREALMANALMARSADAGRGARIAAAAWAAPILDDTQLGALVGATLARAWDSQMCPPSPPRRAAGAQPMGGWRTWCVGGVVPLFRPADVMRVFPPLGAEVKPVPAGQAREPTMTETILNIAKRRKRERQSLIRFDDKGARTGVAAEMRAIRAELPTGMCPSKPMFMKVFSDLYPKQ
jgi:hypothetical protein